MLDTSIRVSVGITGKLWRKVGEDEVAEWLELHNQGLSFRAIGRRCGRDHHVIGSWLAKHGVSKEAVRRNRRYPRSKRGPYKATRDTYKYKLKNRISTVLQMARRRAEQHGLPIDISTDHIVSLYEQQEGRCALTGIPFDLGPAPTNKRANPYIFSIDRIEPSLGYTKSNVRLVIWAINWALGEWGEDVYRQVARCYLNRNA